MSAKLPRLNAPPHFANRVALVKQATAEFFSTRRNAKQSAPGLLQFPTHAFSPARRFDRPSVETVAHGTLSVVGRWLSVVSCQLSVVRRPSCVASRFRPNTESGTPKTRSPLCTLHSALCTRRSTLFALLPVAYASGSLGAFRFDRRLHSAPCTRRSTLFALLPVAYASGSLGAFRFAEPLP